jgi:3-carboxy-cis,cis-muconate cycloisomerase
MRQVVVGLRVDTERMRENLEATGGLIYAEAISNALARTIGRAAAHELVESACQRAREEGRHLLEVILSAAGITEHLSREELKSLFDPQLHVRAAARLVDGALAVASSSISSLPTEGISCPSQK